MQRYRLDENGDAMFPDNPIVWSGLLDFERERHVDGFLGDFDGGDGVRFTLVYRPTCYRRGPYVLQIEIANGPGHVLWGCFDDQDQPTRYYHEHESVWRETAALARVLVRDRERHGPVPDALQIRAAAARRAS